MNLQPLCWPRLDNIFAELWVRTEVTSLLSRESTAKPLTRVAPTAAKVAIEAFILGTEATSLVTGMERELGMGLQANSDSAPSYTCTGSYVDPGYWAVDMQYSRS